MGTSTAEVDVVRQPEAARRSRPEPDSSSPGMEMVPPPPLFRRRRCRRRRRPLHRPVSMSLQPLLPTLAG